jgi:NitT/TauT family transport system substrate-binding protein
VAPPQRRTLKTVTDPQRSINLSRFLRAAAIAATALVTALSVAACGGDDDDAGAPSGGETTASGQLTPVKLQLQWVTQAQFAGYFAAVEKGFYKDAGLDVQILEGGVDIVPQTVLAQGQADFAIAWVPKALQSREQGAAITDVGQVFQRSGTLQVSFKDKNIATAANLKGKKVGNWGFGNEFELFAGMTKAGLDPSKDVTLVQQQFDMQALLKGDIDAAQAMIYNEYAQVLEAENPDTGQLYTPEDFNAIDWNKEGTAMLQDAIWANTEKLESDKAYQDTTVKFLKASFQGWMHCRENAEECRDIVVARGSKLGASHQLWQMNEINKLIWPSPNGIGMVDKAAWDQTVKIAQETRNADGDTVLTKAPEGLAYTNEYAEKALQELSGEDTKGDSFEPIEVELKKGGA